jgi:hypothetical protein
MSGDERGSLRIESSGGWPVTDVVEFLDSFRSAYEGLMILDALLRSFTQEAQRFGRRIPYTLGEYPDLSFYSLSMPSLALTLPQEVFAHLIRPQDRLILLRARFSSPGFWEFMGSLNPLEVVRKYLDDRHRRRQDREYREGQERRRLELDNLLLENQVFRERIQLAQELGLPGEALVPLINRFVGEPMQRLGTTEDRGVIEVVEVDNGRNSSSNE